MVILVLTPSNLGGEIRRSFLQLSVLSSLIISKHYSVPFTTADALGTPLLKVEKGSFFGCVMPISLVKILLIKAHLSSPTTWH